jgi:hypothetical protein
MTSLSASRDLSINPQEDTVIAAIRSSIFRIGAITIVAAGVLLAPAAVPFAADQPAAGVVQVTYIRPEAFRDIGDNGRVTTDKRRDALLAELARHVERIAAPRIPTGSTLSITVTGVDMAGDFEWWRGPRADHVRIVKDVYPPRISLGFRLVDASSNTLAEGRRELTDPAFLTGIEYRNDLLRHEKKLLDDWLAREFPERQP